MVSKILKKQHLTKSEVDENLIQVKKQLTLGNVLRVDCFRYLHS